MISVYHKNFEIEITSYINLQGNTSYILDVFDYSKGGTFAYRLIRYQWGGGASNYLLCADANGWLAPRDVRVKELLDGFNWSVVRRALKDRARFHDTWFLTPHFKAVRYGK